MKVSINGVDVEMACFNCFHWMGNREAPTTPGICIAKPPTAFMVFVQEGDIVTAELKEKAEIKSAWPPVVGTRRCGAFIPFQSLVPAEVPAGVTRQ